jgi:hypothetical protein
MFANQFINNVSSKVIAAFAVLVVAGFAFLAVHNSANAQAGGPPAELPSATEARQELSKIPTDRIGRIKDARQREAVQRVVTSLQAVANNKTQSREAALVAEVDRSFNAFAAAVKPTAANGCFSGVNDDRLKCQASCKQSGKKFCGCLAIAIADGILCIIN